MTHEPSQTSSALRLWSGSVLAGDYGLFAGMLSASIIEETSLFSLEAEIHQLSATVSIIDTDCSIVLLVQLVREVMGGCLSNLRMHGPASTRTMPSCMLEPLWRP